LGNEIQANSYTEGYQGEPAVATFSDGRFVVVWMSGCPKGYGLDCDENLPTQDGSNAGVFGQLFDGTGTKVGAEFQVNTFASDFQGSAQVATFGDGGFMVSWDSGCEGESGCDWGDQCQDGSFKGVYAQVFGPDGLKVGPEVQVNSYTNWSQQDSSLAVHAAGKVLVVWGSDGQAGFGSMSDIFGKWVPLPQAPTQ
jgi:hypothetical protein